MSRATFAAIATIASSGTALAGGLDRSGQSIEILFEPGTIAELTFGSVSPDVTGRDVAAFGGRATGNVAESYLQGSLGYKQDLSDALSFALIIDQPYGADIDYLPAASGGSVAFGGTEVTLDSVAYTGLLRYRINERFSVHGGIRAQKIDANVTLQGRAYGALGAGAGYNADFDNDTAFGYQVGAAYEIPEIALRVSATYFSEIDHDFETRELRTPLGPIPGTSITKVTTPRALNLAIESGIAKDTLAFASFRYADYNVTKVSPVIFARVTGGQSLTDIDTGRDFTIGIGRRFSDMFSGAVSLNYTDGGPDNLVSPLAPTDGRYGITVSGAYNVNENVRISGGVNYARIGDARPKTGIPEVARANFEDNDVIGFGMKLSYRF